MMSAGALFVLGILEGALLENVSSNCDSTGLVVEFRLCRLFRSVFPKTRREETLDSLAIELELKKKKKFQDRITYFTLVYNSPDTIVLGLTQLVPNPGRILEVGGAATVGALCQLQWL